MGLQPGGRWTIYLIAAVGGQAEQLVKDNKFYADGNWSPDGRKIVYGEEALNPNATGWKLHSCRHVRSEWAIFNLAGADDFRPE
jgi:Tol biopolymer transport system component